MLLNMGYRITGLSSGGAGPLDDEDSSEGQVQWPAQLGPPAPGPAPAIGCILRLAGGQGVLFWFAPPRPPFFFFIFPCYIC